MTQIKVALDWTPNTLHSGIFLAQEKGYFKARGLNVSIVDPSSEDYATTPARKLSEGKIDLALCPSESVIAYQTASTPVAIKAVAALLAKDASAIVSNTATRPKELTEKSRYASYGARFEDSIVKKMIQNDGGSGNFQSETPSKLGIWEALLNQKYDATWVFQPWEGVQAKRKGIELNYFQMGDYGVPYGYSPVIAINEDRIGDKHQAIKHCLAAIAAGYQDASQDPKAAVQAVKKAILAGKASKEDADEEFLLESQNEIAGYYNLEGSLGFGQMSPETWQKFVAFLQEENLIKDKNGKDISILADKLFDNGYLQD